MCTLQEVVVVVVEVIAEEMVFEGGIGLSQ